MSSEERQKALNTALGRLSGREKEVMETLLTLLELEAADSSITYPVAKACARAHMRLNREVKS